MRFSQFLDNYTALWLRGVRYINMRLDRQKCKEDHFTFGFTFLHNHVHKLTMPPYLKGLREFDKVLLNLLADIQLCLQPLGFVSLIKDLTFECTLRKKTHACKLQLEKG